MLMVVAVLAAVTGVRGADLVVFKPGDAGLPSSFVTATPTVLTANEARWDFDRNKPLFAEYPKLFGGVRFTDSASTLSTNTTMMRLHDNNPAGWPNKPSLFWQGSDSSAGKNFFNLSAVFVFKKADFAGNPTGRVALPVGSSLRLNILSWYNAAGVDGSWPVQVRFLVNNGGQYYVSDTVYTEAKAGALALADVATAQWAPVTLSSTEFSLPADLKFGPVTLDDLQEVGWIGTGSGTYLRWFAVDEFTVTTP